MDNNMKCLKNASTGNIIRVSNESAHTMVGSKWSYVPKSEWKNQERGESVKEESNGKGKANK